MVLSFILWVVGGLLTTLVFTEVLGYNDQLAEYIVKLGVRKYIPPEEQERYEQEFIADLQFSGRTDRPISLLILAFRIMWQARETGIEVREDLKTKEQAREFTRTRIYTGEDMITTLRRDVAAQNLLELRGLKKLMSNEKYIVRTRTPSGRMRRHIVARGDLERILGEGKDGFVWVEGPYDRDRWLYRDESEDDL